MSDGNQSIMISREWYEAVRFIATVRGIRATGKWTPAKKQSMKEVMEHALESTYGSLAEINAQREEFTEPQSKVRAIRELINDPDQLFQRMLTASLVYRATNAKIEEFPADMVVPSDFDPLGVQYRVRDLCYHLRSTKAKVNCLRDLVIAYQFGR